MLMIYTLGNASKIPVSYECAHYWRAYCYVCCGAAVVPGTSYSLLPKSCRSSHHVMLYILSRIKGLLSGISAQSHCMLGWVLI